MKIRTAVSEQRWRLLLLSHSVVSDSLRPHGLQHAGLPCPSLSPGACSNPCPLNQRCHPTISSSVVPFFSCPQSCPASGSFPTSWLFTSGGQSIGASVLASVLSMNIQGGLPLGWTGLISLQSQGLSRVFSITAIWKHQFFSASLWSNFHILTARYKLWNFHSAWPTFISFSNLPPFKPILFLFNLTYLLTLKMITVTKWYASS